MKLVLQIVAILACILLLIQVVYGIVRYYNGNQKLSRGRTIANWIILAVMLLCWGGSQLVGDSSHFNSHVRTSRTVKAHSSSSKVTKNRTSSSVTTNQAAPKIAFKKHATLDQNGQAIVEFKVPTNTELQIINSANKRGLLSTVNPSSTQAMPVDFSFFQNGDYDIIAMRGKKKTTSHLTVGPQQDQNGQSNSSSKGNNQNMQGSQANNGGTHIEYRRRLVPIN